MEVFTRKDMLRFKNSSLTLGEYIEKYKIPVAVTNSKRFSMDLVRVLSHFNNVSVEDIYSEKRFREMVFVRYIAVYYLFFYTRLSVTKIGKLIGRDHASVVHYIRTIMNTFMYDRELQHLYDGTRSTILHLIKRHGLTEPAERIALYRSKRSQYYTIEQLREINMINTAPESKPKPFEIK